MQEWLLSVMALIPSIKEVFDIQKNNHITIISKRRKVMLSTSAILYVLMIGKKRKYMFREILYMRQE